VSLQVGPVTAPHRRRARRGGSAGLLRLVLRGGVGSVVGGALCGLLWWWLAPMARADVVDGGVYLTGHAELQAAQDGWFVVVLALAGVAVATYQSLRPPGHEVLRAVLGPVAVTVVGLVAWGTGYLLGPGSLAAQVRAGEQHPLTPMQLHTLVALAVGPLMFCVTRFLAALFSREPQPWPHRPGDR
jgi:hypothetical protein